MLPSIKPVDLQYVDLQYVDLQYVDLQYVDLQSNAVQSKRQCSDLRLKLYTPSIKYVIVDQTLKASIEQVILRSTSTLLFT
jgi:uncharacterized protein YjbI with pentapeptide repeats